MTDSPRFPPSDVRCIEILAFHDVQLLDVAGPLQVFATANDIVCVGGGRSRYSLAVVAAGAHPVASSSGLALVAAPLPDPDGVPPDTLMIAGGWGVSAAARDTALLDWVRARSARTRRIASVCSGAFVLAAAGLLDGRRAATHWTRCAELQQRFPAVRVEADPIFIQDGEIWTSAGVSSGIDLALAMVEADCGRPLALAVARQLVVFLKRPGGQAQFSAALELQGAEGPFGTLHSWIIDHLAGNLSVEALAWQAGMSERTFSRRYREQSGLTPARAVEKLRVEAARQMLADSEMPVKAIARRCGFGAEETMRRSFSRLLAASPQAYRERFAGSARPAAKFSIPPDGKVPHADTPALKAEQEDRRE